mmetsp:Transcript_13412/g.34798  ORF Transcript_13412/g.34798 Transcript_13412/m.34798 type:complete len:227 (+) Transcript_13412:1922-2602(+)
MPSCARVTERPRIAPAAGGGSPLCGFSVRSSTSLSLRSSRLAISRAWAIAMAPSAADIGRGESCTAAAREAVPFAVGTAAVRGRCGCTLPLSAACWQCTATSNTSSSTSFTAGCFCVGSTASPLRTGGLVGFARTGVGTSSPSSSSSSYDASCRLIAFERLLPRMSSCMSCLSAGPSPWRPLSRLSSREDSSRLAKNVSFRLAVTGSSSAGAVSDRSPTLSPPTNA